LSVGLYRQNDAEAMAAAYELAKRQQNFLNQLRADKKFNQSETYGASATSVAGATKGFSGGGVESDTPRPSTAVANARRPSMRAGAALQAQLAEDKSLQAGLSSDTRTAAREMAAAMIALRKLNTAAP
jgi:hypothetical protein